MSEQEIPIKVASEALGISPKTVWRRIQKGEIPARKVAGQWLVDIGQQQDREDKLSGQKGQGVMSDLAILQSTIEVLRQQLEQKDRQISELHILLAQKQLPEPLPEPTKTPWWKFLEGPWKKLTKR